MKHKKTLALILSLLMIFSAIPAYGEEEAESTLSRNKFHDKVSPHQAEEIRFCKKSEKPPEATEDKGDISVADTGGKIHVYANGNKYWVVHETDDIIRFPTDCNSLFFNYTQLTTLTFANIDTQNVTDMNGMFANCHALTTLDVSRFNTQKVTDMALMFANCHALTTLDVSRFNTQKVTDMNGMFTGCYALTTLDVSRFNTQKVTDMNGMFTGCKALTTLDVSRFNTQKVTDMKYMFAYCHALTTITVSPQFTTDLVTASGDMFKGCTALKGGKGTSYDGSHTDKEYARMDNPPTAPGYFTASTILTHTVTFEANGGNGNMANVTVNDGDNYTLPPCTFTPPDGKVFDQWEAGGTKYNPGDSINNITAALSVKALWKAKPTPPPPSVPTSPTTPPEDEFITLKTSFNGKLYTAQGTRNTFNGAEELDVTVDKQGKTHINFLDKEGNKVKTKGAVKVTMPVKEGMSPPTESKSTEPTPPMEKKTETSSSSFAPWKT